MSEVADVRLLPGGCLRLTGARGVHLGDFAPSDAGRLPEAARARAEALWTAEVLAAWAATQAVPEADEAIAARRAAKVAAGQARSRREAVLDLLAGYEPDALAAALDGLQVAKR